MQNYLNYDKSNNVNFLDNLSSDEQHNLSYLLDLFTQWYENEYDEGTVNCDFFSDSLKQLYEMTDALQYRKCLELSNREM